MSFPIFGEVIEEEKETDSDADFPIFGEIIEEKEKPSRLPPKEGGIQTFNRYLGQVPHAAITLATWPGAITTALGKAEALEEFDELKERLPRLQKLFPEAPWENFKGLDKDLYMKAIEEAGETGPTPENITQVFEDITTLPLTAKTRGQNFLHNLLTAAGFKKGTAAQKAHTGLKAGAYSTALQLTGGDPDVADFLASVLALHELPSPRFRRGGRTPTKYERPPYEPPTRGVPPDEPPLTDPESDRLYEAPFFKDLVPEHEILERVQPVLEKELERQLGEIPALRPIEIKTGVPPQEPVTSPHSLKRSVGKEISPTAFPNPRVASQAIRGEINSLSENQYKEINKAFDLARELNADISEIHPPFINKLEELVEEINKIPEPSSVQKDLRTIAKKFINRGTVKEKGKIVGYRPLDNASLIGQIQSNHQKIKHDYVQGQPANAYLHLNNLISEALESTAVSFPEAVEAFRNAQSMYKNWADVFKSSEMMPWRDPARKDFISLLKKIENPDQLKAFEPILSQTPKGEKLYEMLVRDYVEKELEPFIQNPKKIGGLDFERKMREVGVVLSPSQRGAIEDMLYHEYSKGKNYKRLKEQFDLAEKGHQDLLKKQQEDLTALRKKGAELEKAFPYKTDGSILRDLETVRGQKRLESFLPKTEEGKALMDELKDYSAVNLLTQGKINPSAKSSSLRVILNDVNKRALLEHTLGKAITRDLREIVNNIPEIDKRLSKGHSALRIAKAVAKLTPGLRGTVASTEALYDTWRMLKPAIEKGEYGLVDLDTIRLLIEHRRDLLGS